MRKNKEYSLLDLEKMAFRNHSISLTDLRKAIYAKEMGKEYPKEVGEHIRGCDYCQKEIEFLKRTDPTLTRGRDSHLKVLIQAAENPATAQKIEDRAKKALTTSIGNQCEAIINGATAFMNVVIDNILPKIGVRRKGI